MVLILCILFSLLISKLPRQAPSGPQGAPRKGLTPISVIFIPTRETGAGETQFAYQTGFTTVTEATRALPTSQNLMRDGTRRKNERTEQTDCMRKSDIVEQGYDLSINRYKEIVYEEVEHRPPQEILDELEGIEKEITKGMKQLRGMLK